MVSTKSAENRKQCFPRGVVYLVPGSAQERRERKQRTYKSQERKDIRTQGAFWKVTEV